MATVTVTKDKFESLINSNNTVILDFWATWCGPCRMFSPIFEKASERHPEIVFGKVNTEEQQDLAATFQIRSIPTLMVFKEKTVIFSQPGALPSDVFDELIDKVKAVDMNDIRERAAKQKAAAGGGDRKEL